MKTEAKEKVEHTPGPWELDWEGGDAFALYHRTETCAMAGEVLDGYPNERGANARLIAAAPDLLEALKDCMALRHAMHVEGRMVTTEEYERVHNAANEAIAKAEPTR